MEQNDKIRLLLDMHEHPENYSDEQLARLLDDEQMATLWQQLATAKRAMTDAPEPDVDTEWQRFEQQHFTPSTNRRWLKVAAMFIGVLMLSAFTYAAIHAVRAHRTEVQQTTTEQMPSSRSAVETSVTQMPDPDSTAVEETPVTFDNVPLEDIINDIATRHQLQVEFRNEEVRGLRFYFSLKPHENLDSVLERLNMFESVNISKEGNIIVVE
jgi:type II secretory pathway component PulM